MALKYCGSAIVGESVGIVDSAIILEGVIGDNIDGSDRGRGHHLSKVETYLLSNLPSVRENRVRVIISQNCFISSTFTIINQNISKQCPFLF